jgi:hypothetical protein
LFDSSSFIIGHQSYGLKNRMRTIKATMGEFETSGTDTQNLIPRERRSAAISYKLDEDE